MKLLPALLAAPVLSLTLLGASPAAAEDAGQQPRPGCGYGDDNHSHQAAPGRDTETVDGTSLVRRPGKGTGDDNHAHTAPPGQAPAGGGGADDPARGCRPDPRG